MHSGGGGDFKSRLFFFFKWFRLATPKEQIRSVKEFGFIESPQTAAEPQNRFNYKFPTLGKRATRTGTQELMPEKLVFGLCTYHRFEVTFSTEESPFTGGWESGGIAVETLFELSSLSGNLMTGSGGSSNSCGGIYGGSYSPHPIPGVSWGRSQ